jgi:hypothetical protein
MRAFLISVALVACGGNNDSGGNCKLGNVCEDYPTGDLAAHEKDCKALTGVWSKGSCPSGNLLGTCLTPDQQTRRYYGGGDNAFTPATAAASCEHEFHGTWTAK